LELLTSDGSHGAHFRHVIHQINARVTAIRKLLTDPYLTVQVKRILMISALCLVLEYASEVLVPTTAQCTALESVQLTAVHLILGCPTWTPSEAIWGDVRLSLLISRRDMASLAWQHTLHSMSPAPVREGCWRCCTMYFSH
jgi:hypothetical protein